MALGMLSCVWHLNRAFPVYSILCYLFLHGYGCALCVICVLTIDRHVLVDFEHHGSMGIPCRLVYWIGLCTAAELCYNMILCAYLMCFASLLCHGFIAFCLVVLSVKLIGWFSYIWVVAWGCTNCIVRSYMCNLVWLISLAAYTAQNEIFGPGISAIKFG